MADTKIKDSRDQHKTFPSINRNEIIIDYYDFCGEEESNFIYQRNLFKTLPVFKLGHFRPCANSLVNYKKEMLIDQNSVSLAKSLSNFPENVKKEDRAKFERLKNLYLLHEIPDFTDSKGQKLNDFETDLKNSIECSHPSVARIIGYTLKHPKGKENSFLLLTERPVNGSLYSYFNFLSGYNSPKKKCSKDHFKSTISEPYNNKKINLSNEQKYLIILGVICGIEFIHQLGFVHSKLNPTTIFLNEQLQSVICDYEFKHEIKKIDDDNISIFYKYPSFVAPETHQDQIITQKSDIFSFGMLIYYILTGELPFAKISNKQTISLKIIDDQLPSLPDGFGDCWSLLYEWCCDRNPENRPDSEELMLQLLDKKNINEYVKSMSPGYNPKFTGAQLDYINLLFDVYTQNQNHKNLSDFDIYDFIDREDIHQEDKETFIGCNQLNVECIKKVANYFLHGENDYPIDKQNAKDLYQQAASLDDPESNKILGKLYHDSWSTKSDLRTSLTYYQTALELYEGNKAECEKIQREINQIEEELTNTAKSFPQLKKGDDDDDDDDDGDDEKNHGKVTFETNKTITFQEISNKATKESIINFFKAYKIVKVEIKPHSFSQSAKITFENIEDKTKVLKRIRKHPREFRLHDEQMRLMPTRNMIRRQRAMRRAQRAPLGSSAIPRHILNRNNKVQLDLNNFYPGPKKNEYELIGFGAFGNVYKIYDKKNNNVFIAKVFKKGFEEPKERKKFRREIAALTEIRHPLIIRLYGFEMHSLISPESNTPTLIMEYAPNNTLAHANSTNPDWWDKTTKIMAILGITRAMAYIHNRKYIHRDLKPENIFFDENHEIKIGDFGCSRKYNSNDIMTNGIGTPLYSAPELFDENHVNYSYEVDVYSFGIILLEILTGKPPNPPNKIYYKLIKNVISGWRPDIPPGLDENLKKLITLCWSKFVNDRPLFQEIFTIFKSLFDEPLNKDSYFKEILEGVDIPRVKNYLAKLESYEH